MRLIDADALMKKWLDQPDPPFKCDNEVVLMEKLCSDWIDLINEAPTIEPTDTDLTVSEKLKLIQDLLGVEFKEENLNYEHATLVDVKEPLKVEVVRCKDCYYAEDDITHMYCGYFCHKVYGDDYCSNAVERREP